MITTAALVALLWSSQSAPEVRVVLYSQEKATTVLADLAKQAVSMPPSAPGSARRDATKKLLERKGYQVSDSGQLLVGIDSKLDFSIEAKQLQHLAEALKGCDSDGIFHVKPGENGASDQLMREACLTSVTALSNSGFNIALTPVVQVSLPGKPTGTYESVFLPWEDAGSKLKSSPFRQKIAPENQRVDSHGVVPRRQRNIVVEWTSGVDMARELSVAEAVLQEALAASVKVKEAALYDLDQYVQKKFAKELGGAISDKSGKFSDLSPWLRDQALTRFKQDYARFGFASPDDAASYLTGQSGVNVRLCYGYTYFVSKPEGEGHFYSIVNKG